VSYITQDLENAGVRPGKCAARQTLPAVPLKANLSKYLPGGNVWAYPFRKRKKCHHFEPSAFTFVIKISNHKQSTVTVFWELFLKVVFHFCVI